MPSFNVTALDFDKIKQSIIEYFKANERYADWNFDGSGLSVLMDVLAYNTHYNAMLAHLSLNETFLDSAQLRSNVVSHAKLLGYVPRSTLSSTAILDIVVPTVGSEPYADTVTIARGTRFSTVVSSNKYYFVNLDPVTATYNADTGTYNFTYNEETGADSRVTVKQGTLKRMLYRVDSSVANQKFVLPDDNVDITTIRVRIKSNENTSDYAIYTRFSTLSTVTSTSQIYFIQENSEGNYEIYFGDNNFGVKPIDNQVVEIEYVYTNGTVANGASSFVAVDAINSTIPISVTVTNDSEGNPIKSYGGAGRETIESIRYNAPLTFIAQNRAVTADDYRAIILQEFGNIKAISVWGGENEPIPSWGRVYICIKPTSADALTEAEKNSVINFVKSKNVVSITPIVVDPEYTNLALDVNFKYNPNLTDNSEATLISFVRAAITEYNDDNLDRFDGVFRLSKILNKIDSADASILNSDVRVYMYKDIEATTGASNYFDLQFTSPIIHSSVESTISSSAFKFNGADHFFADEAIDGSNDRQVYMFKYVNGNAVKVANCGTVYTSAGRVILNNFIPDVLTNIRITAIPDSNDLAPKRNQLLQIDPLSVTIAGEVDTIAVAGSSGAINYTTPSRTR